MTQFIETLVGIFQSSGFAKFGEPGGWLYAVMICVGCSCSTSPSSKSSSL